MLNENNIPVDNIFIHLQDGITLNELDLRQSPLNQLPLFIPTRTHEIKTKQPLPYDWVGVDTRFLISQHTKSTVNPRSHLSNPVLLRSFLGVKQNCSLLAVLNARDDTLEQFWGMPRLDLLEALERCGFSAVTGPTFSVMYESEGFLPSHNILMMMRHHQVISEIAMTKLVAIPNIYWRNSSSQEEWVDWINSHPTVSVVSRDFSLTKNTDAFQKALDGLLVILRAVNRPLHILCVGVGPGHAHIALHRLAEIGCTATVITSAPILSAIKGGLRYLNNGSLPPSSTRDPKTRRNVLARINVAVLASHLKDVAASIPLYTKE